MMIHARCVVALLGALPFLGCATDFGRRAAAYASGRALDLADCLTVKFGSVMGAHVHFQATDCFGTGAGLMKGYQVGFEGRRWVLTEEWHEGLPIRPLLNRYLNPVRPRGETKDLAFERVYGLFITDRYERYSMDEVDIEFIRLRCQCSILFFNILSLPPVQALYSESGYEALGEDNWPPKLVDALDLEIAGGVVLGGRVGFSLGQFLDFLLGWVGIDIGGDDTSSHPPEPPTVPVKPPAANLNTMRITFKQVAALGKPGETFLGPREDTPLPDEHPLALVPGGDMLLTRDPWGVLRLRDLAKGDIVRTLGTKGSSPRDRNLTAPFAFSADGSRLAVSQHTGNICVWDVGKGTLVAEFAERGAHMVAISADGGRVLGADWSSGAVRVWDVDSRKEVRRLNGIGSAMVPVVPVSLSPDGSFAGVLDILEPKPERSSGTQWRLRVWDLRADTPPRQLYTGPARFVSWGEQWLLVEHLKDELIFTDLTTGKRLSSALLPELGSYLHRQHQAILPGGQRIAAVFQQTTVTVPKPGAVGFPESLCVYDLATGALLGRAPTPKATLCLGLFCDGTRILTMDCGPPPTELFPLLLGTSRCPVRVWEVTYSPQGH